MRKLRYYVASSVYLRDARPEHVQHWGRQFTIAVHAESKAAVARMLGVSRRHLTDFCGIHERAPESRIRCVSGPFQTLREVCAKPSVVYYATLEGWAELPGKETAS